MTLKISAYNILEGLSKVRDLGNEDGLIQGLCLNSDQIVNIAAISYDFKEAASSFNFTRRDCY